MPFPNDRGLVTHLFQELGKSLLIPIEDISIRYESIDMAVFARLDHCPAGTANGIGNVTAGKPHPFTREPIDMRGLHIPSTVTREVIVGHIIPEDKEQIRRSLFTSRQRRNRQHQRENRENAGQRT